MSEKRTVLNGVGERVCEVTFVSGRFAETNLASKIGWPSVPLIVADGVCMLSRCHQKIHFIMT